MALFVSLLLTGSLWAVSVFHPCIEKHRLQSIMALSRLQALRCLRRSINVLDHQNLLRGVTRLHYQRHLLCRHYEWLGFSLTRQYILPCDFRSIMTCSNNYCSGICLDFGSKRVAIYGKCCEGTRSMSTLKAPSGERKMTLKVTMLSPGFLYEPYAPREPISFWRRWFTPSGWQRTKEDLIMEMKSAFAISRLRKVTRYSKKFFYDSALRMYKEINTLMAKGDASPLRKMVTEKMYSILKNEIKRRQAMWSSVHWELVEPVISIRTLRARMIGLDKDDLNKSFVQLTIEITSKQRFEAYDSKGAVVSGDKKNEVLVRDIWVFERSLFHPGAEWRLCARITI